MPDLRPALAAAAAAAISAGLMSCSPGPDATPPNIVLISIDTLRYDYLGTTGAYSVAPDFATHQWRGESFARMAAIVADWRDRPASEWSDTLGTGARRGL